MKSIGVTGGIGSGKSIVCKILEVMGFPVFYSDAEAKKCMVEDADLMQGVKQLLGENAYIDGELNRPFVAEKIFSDAKVKAKMDELVHPAVYRAFEKWKKQQSSDLIFNESALLFETGSHSRFDEVILVIADLETRVARVIKRDQVQKEAVITRIQHQMLDEHKLKMSPYVIENDSHQMLIPQLLKFIEKMR
ncbi:MAG: dephospho-CoA kinase [Crocinitomicaceae bacterium]|nr:dephospho-CoA kinase [Crocinitomicaceae bacterium]